MARSAWQTRPIFVSSTFSDMQAERDHLRLGERSRNRSMVEEAVNTLRAAVQHHLGQGRRDGAKEVQEHLERAEKVLRSMPSQGV